MKRNLGVLAAASLLAAVVGTNALATGHDGGAGAVGTGGGPLLDNGPVAPPPTFNPVTPYTVPQSPETPVSPASPGSIFGNG
jgi:hypothetical protein